MVGRRETRQGTKEDRDAQWVWNIRQNHRNRQQGQMTMRNQRNNALVFREIGVRVDRLVRVSVNREARDEEQQRYGQQRGNRLGRSQFSRVAGLHSHDAGN
jgi:hypothetical protein